MSVYQVAVDAHRLLTEADLVHGFGGGLALNYYAEPRATIDVDLCVFVPWSEGVADIDRFAAIGCRPTKPSMRPRVARLRAMVKQGRVAEEDR